MTPPSLVYSILVQWAAQSPVLLAYLAGIVVALICWQRCRIPSVLTLCAMVLLGAFTYGLPVATLNLYRWQKEHHWTIKQIGSASLAINLTASVGHAAGIGLLLAAVFHRRSAPAADLPLNSPPPLPLP